MDFSELDNFRICTEDGSCEVPSTRSVRSLDIPETCSGVCEKRTKNVTTKTKRIIATVKMSVFFFVFADGFIVKIFYQIKKKLRSREEKKSRIFPDRFSTSKLLNFFISSQFLPTEILRDQTDHRMLMLDRLVSISLNVQQWLLDENRIAV